MRDGIPSNIDDAVFLNNFTDSYHKRGKSYWQEGRVIDFIIEKNNIIRGRVAGTYQDLYEIEIQFAQEKTYLDIEGQCTCPVAYNCKHVVALLYALKQHLNSFNQKINHSQPQLADFQLSSWLENWKYVKEQKHTIAANSSQYIILYELNRADLNPNSPITANVFRAKKLKKGGVGQQSKIYPENILKQQLINTDCLDPEDFEIIKMLYMLSRLNPGQAQQLHGHEGARLLIKMLETGRCYWENQRHLLLHEALPRQGKLGWEILSDGKQRPQLVIEPAATPILGLTPYFYIDLNSGAMGQLALKESCELINHFLRGPVISPKQVPLVNKSLAALIQYLPIPKELRANEIKQGTVISAKPVPTITLTHVNIQLPQHYHQQGVLKSEAAALLGFRYNNIFVASHEPATEIDIYQDNAVHKVKRDLNSETIILSHFVSLGFSNAKYGLRLECNLPHAFLLNTASNDSKESRWMRFILEEVPRLKTQGWLVSIEHDFPYKPVNVDSWHLRVDDQVKNNWFDLTLGIRVEGEEINLLPILIQLIKTLPDNFINTPTEAGAHIAIPLNDGRIVAVPAERIKTLLGTLVELYDQDRTLSNGRLRYAEVNGGELLRIENSLEGLTFTSTGGERLKQLARNIENFGGITAIAVPNTVTATLRPYQQQGLNWLQFLREYSLGGILADDMGLGKTVQALAHIAVEKQSGRMDLPCLVAAPASVVYNWQAEAAKYTPELKVLAWHGPGRKIFSGSITQYDVIVTNYSLILKDIDFLKSQEYHLFILDEAQYIKNPHSKIKAACHQIISRHRLGLTGTPLENHLGELWSLFDFLMPGYLRDYRWFQRLFRLPIETKQDDSRRQQLSQRIKPFLLRRTKDLVAPELPQKTEIILHATFGDAQRDFYEVIRLAMEEKIRKVIKQKGLKRSHIEILDALLKLRQVCCDPGLVKISQAGKIKESAKLTLLMELLETLLEENRKILLFSQFTQMLDRIMIEIDKKKIDYVVLTGKSKKRGEIVDQFQQGNIPLFLISLKAGGTGLNLTAADTVIHYDPWWNPAVENQATDRAHRLGQNKPVFVYKLIVKDTVEERILNMQARKRALSAGLLDQKKEMSEVLNQQDLESLFLPIQ